MERGIELEPADNYLVIIYMSRAASGENSLRAP
jgi:hypothetical protein